MSPAVVMPLLETFKLPGWPEVYHPTLLNSLAFTVLWPVGIAAVMILFIQGPVWFRRHQPASTEVEKAQ